jgi:hypothetical protein
MIMNKIYSYRNTIILFKGIRCLAINLAGIASR